MPSRLAGRDRTSIGQYGENIATAFLRSRGTIILARNFRGRRKGEVDIIARHGKLLLFVEVKTRAENSPIRGLDAVNRSKQILIERGANDWLRRLRTRDLPWRFDVIEIIVAEGKKPVIRHIENAF